MTFPLPDYRTPNDKSDSTAFRFDTLARKFPLAVLDSLIEKKPYYLAISKRINGSTDLH